MTPLSRLLSDSASRRPDSPAVIDPDREVTFSYRQLDGLASDLAKLLGDLGFEAGDRVGVYGHKSTGTVAAIFGALRSGVAYVPVDPDAPLSRNSYIFQDCSVRGVFVERSISENLLAELGWKGEVRELPETMTETAVDLVLVFNTEHRTEAEKEDNLAYILYTSGSTGKPKGVMHTHFTCLSFVDWCSDVFEPSADDRFSSHAPFHFDLSILDLYVPIKHASAIVIIGEDVSKQPVRLAELISVQRISMWYSTPSILRLLVEYGRMEEYDYAALRIVNFAGEVFPVKYLRALTQIWPHPRYFNLYGPTETNVCTYYEVDRAISDDRVEPYPIGRKCSGDETLVVDENDNAVAVGEEGELLVSGGSVMIGYWNLPNRTEQAFHVDSEGVKWYRTGDVVREDDEGEYLFVGRRDRMVKRRGYRVELGEVESAFYKMPEVEEVAAIAIPDEENGVLIEACLNWKDNSKPSLIKLKQFAAANLPLYMIPDRFSFYESLPKTSTDKIDYQSLLGSAAQN